MTHFSHPLPDCPACGKIEGACMIHAEWGHDIACCSEECGRAVAYILNENTSTPEYRDKLKQLCQMEQELIKLRYKNINLTEPLLQFIKQSP